MINKIKEKYEILWLKVDIKHKTDLKITQVTINGFGYFNMFEYSFGNNMDNEIESSCEKILKYKT